MTYHSFSSAALRYLVSRPVSQTRTISVEPEKLTSENKTFASENKILKSENKVLASENKVLVSENKVLVSEKKVLKQKEKSLKGKLSTAQAKMNKYHDALKKKETPKDYLDLGTFQLPMSILDDISSEP